MGVARLLAKGWIVFCLYAGGHALLRALGANIPAVLAIQQVGVCVALFGAMGLLFIGGYGAASSHLLGRLRPEQLAPGFNEIVFLAFAIACFFMQAVYAPAHLMGPIPGSLEAAIRFAVPGQRALEGGLAVCGLDGGRMLSSAFAWTLAFIFLGSALSRVRLAAGIVRLERKQRPEPLGATILAFILGVASLAGFQVLFMGTGYGFVPCSLLSGVLGDVLIGIAPLMLSYLILAALTDLLALGDEA
ncbi:MAG: hypothetical protein ABSA49_15415 [Rhizomicrobium sp.]|jgi:hypothetical protein